MGRACSLLVVPLLAVVAACGDDEPEVDAQGTYEVAHEVLELVDEERPTPAFGTLPESPTRQVDTEVWYPDGEDGPFPLVVFNHGQQGEPQQYSPTFEAWASAGYVIAAPRHPLSVRGGPGAPFAADIAGEVGDVAFAITSVGDELGDLVDMDRIAVAGHSSGAIIAYAVGFNSCCLDDRIDAVLTESMRNIPFDGENRTDLDRPVLFLHGNRDVNQISESETAFAAAAAPKFFLTLEQGDHSEAYRSGPQVPQVIAAGLAFLDLALKGDDGAADDLAGMPGMQADP